MFPAWDQNLFRLINEWHSHAADPIMQFLSDKYVWIPLYAFFLFLVYKFVGKRVWLVLVCAALAVFLADQISTQAFKHVFLRYRPCHNLILQSQLHLNGNCGGMYGFISSHAANVNATNMPNKNKLLFFIFFILKSTTNGK